MPLLYILHNCANAYFCNQHSLGIREETVENGELGIRLDAIHVRGVDKMSTQDVFRYFQGFAPGSLEWIDDTSCE